MTNKEISTTLGGDNMGTITTFNFSSFFFFTFSLSKQLPFILNHVRYIIYKLHYIYIEIQESQFRPSAMRVVFVKDLECVFSWILVLSIEADCSRVHGWLALQSKIGMKSEIVEANKYIRNTHAISSLSSSSSSRRNSDFESF